MAALETPVGLAESRFASGGIGAWIANASVYVWAGFLVAIALIAVTGTLFAPYDPTSQNVVARLLPPLSESRRGLHWLGTDPLGRDLLSAIIAGARLSLFIGLVATGIGMAIGVSFGMWAGYFGGWIDRLAMRLSEAQTAMPMFLVAIFFLIVLGPSVLNMLIILPALVWPVFARIVRAETLRLRDQ